MFPSTAEKTLNSRNVSSKYLVGRDEDLPINLAAIISLETCTSLQLCSYMGVRAYFLLTKFIHETCQADARFLSVSIIRISSANDSA